MIKIGVSAFNYFLTYLYTMLIATNTNIQIIISSD